MISLGPIHIAENWTSAAGALEGVLAGLDAPLPRHAVMGLSSHAWHLCLGSQDGVVALPSGPSDLSLSWRLDAYRRLGFSWSSYEAPVATVETRTEAVYWIEQQLSAGRPVIGWDFHLREYGIVYGLARGGSGLLVSDLATVDTGPEVALSDWPASGSRIELLAAEAAIEAEPLDVILESLTAALEAFAGHDGLADGQSRGTAALVAWADAFESACEVDRPGNAYTLTVLMAARSDGAAFLADLADSIPDVSAPLTAAAEALRAEARALSPLLTLFPFPSGGHGNVANPGLRRAAATALRRAALHEGEAAERIREALRSFSVT